MKNFALLGAAGYIAPRHMQAIYETENRLLAAVDPHDSVGILDIYDKNIWYFKEPERFERYLNKANKSDNSDRRIDYISVCTPNYLHDSHCRLALYNQADAICEKPVTINPWNLDALEADEIKTGKRVYPIMQMRYHPNLTALKANLSDRHHTVKIVYHTPRGPWYYRSWKGDKEKSGGLLMNIGVHLFDVLIWLFGAPYKTEVSILEVDRARGQFLHDKATVDWELSIDPKNWVRREMVVDEEKIDFTIHKTLHLSAYIAILKGDGLNLENVRPAIELIRRLRFG